jgi:thiamine monophosphate kinase
MSRASGLGAVVNLRDVPLSRSFRRWALAASRGSFDAKFPWRTVAEGGEEYELVFTVRPSDVPALRKRVDFSIVGQMRRGRGVDFMLDGKKLAVEWRGYENF